MWLKQKQVTVTVMNRKQTSVSFMEHCMCVHITYLTAMYKPLYLLVLNIGCIVLWFFAQKSLIQHTSFPGLHYLHSLHDHMQGIRDWRPGSEATCGYTNCSFKMNNMPANYV